MSNLQVNELCMILPLLIVTACLVSCGTLAEQYVSEARSSIQETREELMLAKEQVDNTMFLLDHLIRDDGDLRSKYEDFVDELVESEDMKENLRERLNEIRTQGNEYFKLWKKELESFSNDELRRKCQKRRESALEDYQQMMSAVQAVIDTFELLIVDLKDIQKYLGVDLTPSGITVVSEAVEDSTEDSTELKELMDAAASTLDKAGADLSPENGHEGL